MKTHLNLTIDTQVLASMKEYAESRNVSLSELVEGFFKKVATPLKPKNIIDMVAELEEPSINENDDLKELFYKEQLRKYGF